MNTAKAFGWVTGVAGLREILAPFIIGYSAVTGAMVDAIALGAVLLVLGVWTARARPTRGLHHPPAGLLYRDRETYRAGSVQLVVTGSNFTALDRRFANTSIRSTESLYSTSSPRAVLTAGLSLL